MSVLGFDEAGHGDALLLVHGFPLDRRMWKPQLAGLADLRRVIAPDLRGRGKSLDARPVASLLDHADDLVRTLDALGIERVDLGALSMGGYIALALYARHPERVRSLILISTKADADDQTARRARVATADLARSQGTSALYSAVVPKLVAPAHAARLGAALRTMLAELPGASAANDALAMGQRPDRRTELPGITVPTLVLHGEADAIVPWQNAEQMARAIPGAAFCRITGGGHLLPLEEPGQTNASIRQFIEASSTKQAAERP
jgi:pimeloyl-ACP methyl ester carboxylesterase